MKQSDPDCLFPLTNPDLARDEAALGESYLLRAIAGANPEGEEPEVDFEHFADVDDDADDPPLFI